MANISYKCPTCGAEIFWKAQLNRFECDYCGDAFSLDEIESNAQSAAPDEQNIEHHQELDEGEILESNDGTVGSDLVKYSCSYCGAEIITDRATAATICVYCGNSVIMSEQIINDFKPDYVIPFKIEKDKVMQSFKEFSKKPLTPKSFDCEQVVDKMQGVYIPFWLYSGKCDGQMHAEGINEHTFTDGDYRVKEKKIYDLMRDGTVRFKNVPVDGSSKTDNDAMDSIEPYDYSQLTAFTPAYLSGFLAERFDEDSNVCLPRAKERMENTTLSLLKDSCSYEDVNVKTFSKRTSITETKYALLPTWLLYTTYKDKKYFFAMNGQTGKFIGNLPIDIGKLSVFCTLGAILGGIIGYFLF